MFIKNCKWLNMGSYSVHHHRDPKRKSLARPLLVALIFRGPQLAPLPVEVGTLVILVQVLAAETSPDPPTQAEAEWNRNQP